MMVRNFMQSDLAACLAIRPNRMGQEVIGYERAFAAWKAMSQSLAFRSVVIESEVRPLSGCILGFGASVFVSKDFAYDMTLNPRPGMNERIVASLDRGEPVVLSETELKHENTDGSLSLAILFTSWKEDLSAQQIAEVKLYLAKGGVDCLSGYRLEQIFMEAFDSRDVEYIQSTGVYRMVSDYSNCPSEKQQHKIDRGLFVMDKASVDSIVGSVATFVFQYTRPILRFTLVDQQLLVAALEGFTDRELSEYLGLSTEAVKKRWASVYERVESVMPSLLPFSNNDGPKQTRGLQKRHHLLAYLRGHLEELRPYLV